MKKPHTKASRGGKKGRSKVKEVTTKQTEADLTSERTPWRAALAHPTEEGTDTGRYLKGLRKREGLTQKELAEALSDGAKVSQHHISEMESGKRPISKNMAKKLAAVLGTDYRMFL